MPIALRPATTATRADSALMDRAMSSERPITREDLMPGAGSSSYSVTTGPGWALTISPRTPKSPNTPSSAREFDSSSLLLRGCPAVAAGPRQQRNGGQFELVGRFARCAGCGFLARRARRGGLLVLLVLEILV